MADGIAVEEKRVADEPFNNDALDRNAPGKCRPFGLPWPFAQKNRIGRGTRAPLARKLTLQGRASWRAATGAIA
jgi:hypothetical protein